MFNIKSYYTYHTALYIFTCNYVYIYNYYIPQIHKIIYMYVKLCVCLRFKLVYFCIYL